VPRSGPVAGRGSVVRDSKNRRNAQHSTGPKTPEGKQQSSRNSLKHGYYADVEKLDPRDSPVYQQELYEFRQGLNPDGPVEEKLIRDLAMLTARIQRLEAAEYAFLAGNIDEDPADARALAEAFHRCGDDLDRLHRSEVFLRRAFNRTMDRLERMQKERHKMPLDQALKRSQIWLTYEATRTNNPGLMPARSSLIDEKGNLYRMNDSDRPPKPKPPGAEPEISPQEDPKTA
jgi:hypothetical protein